MTGKADAIINQLKIMETRVGMIGVRLNSIDLRIGNIESRMVSDVPSTSIIEVQTESSEPRAKKLKSFCQADADNPAESVTSTTTTKSVGTPMESKNPGENNIAMSFTGNLGKTKPPNESISFSLPIEHSQLLSSSDEKGKDLSNSKISMGSIHLAVRKRARHAYEKEILNANAAIRMYNLTYQSLNPNAALSHLRFVRYNPDVRFPHTARQIWRLHDDDVKDLLECLDVEVPTDAESRRDLLADLIGVQRKRNGLPLISSHQRQRYC